MAAVYPGAVKAFGAAVVDNADTVYAAHINDLRSEVVAIEETLNTGIKSSTWSESGGAFTTATTTWNNLAARLTNIEKGIITTSNVHEQYLQKVGGTLTGNLTLSNSAVLVMGSAKITGLANGTDSADAVNKSQLDTKLNLSGGTMSGAIAMGGTNKITGLAAGSTSGDALRWEQVLSASGLASGVLATANPVMNGTAAVGTSVLAARSDHVHPSDTSKLNLSGGTMTGKIVLDGAPTTDSHAATKAYVDAAMPIGSVVTYAGSTATLPANWLLCDGSEKAVASYPALDVVLGTTYGARTNGSGGAGSTHFRVPDLRGRVTAGLDNMGGTDANRLDWTNQLGGVGANSKTVDSGEQNHLLTGSESGTSYHNHGASSGETGGHSHSTSSDGSHGHTLAGVSDAATSGSGRRVTGGSGAYYDQVTGGSHNHTLSSEPNHSHTVTVNYATRANAEASHNNMQPTMLLNYIIRAA